MGRYKIGVMLDSFRMDIKEAVKAAYEIGADGVQVYAVQGDMDPDNFGKKDRKLLLDMLKAYGLKTSAVCGDLGGYGFTKAEGNEQKIEKIKKILELAKDLETDIVTTHIGVIPEQGNKTYNILREACEKLGGIASGMDSYLAVETGPEKTQRLKAFLDDLTTRNIKVNYDPANLVMVTGDDPVQGVGVLGDYIVHTHAKDGIMKKQTNPGIIYDFFAEGGIGDLRLDEYFIEVPLGLGSVDFKSYLSALDQIGYSGFLTVEREVGINPYLDIQDAVRYLKALI